MKVKHFKIDKASVCGIVEEVCEAIWTALQDYVRPLQTLKEQLNISRDFESKSGVDKFFLGARIFGCSKPKCTSYRETTRNNVFGSVLPKQYLEP